MQNFRNIPRKTKLAILFAVLVTILIAGMIWLLTPYPAEQKYLEQVYSNDQLTVTELAGWYELIPVESKSDEAIIFYPGGLVSADGYLYMLSGIAVETEQPIYLVKFPLSLAVTNIYAADAIVEQYLNIETWTISGHSLGGSMACRYVGANPDVIDNLVMMASYCDQSISDAQVSVLTLYGTLNNGINASSLADFERNLPSGSATVLIPGMNHAQFGNYGAQRGDNVPSISNEQATFQVQAEVVNFLNELGEEGL